MFGLVLIGIGFEMVHIPPDTARKKLIYRSLFGFFGTAVVVTTFVQAANNAKHQEAASEEAHRNEKELVEKLGAANGKLDAIAQFQNQFIDFVSKHPNATSDETAKAYRAMATAVLKMAQPAPSRTSLTVNYGTPSSAQLRTMSNAELKLYTSNLAEQLNEFDQEWQPLDELSIDEQDNQILAGRMSERASCRERHGWEYEGAFQIRFTHLPELRDVLISKLNGKVPSDRKGELVVGGNVLWGDHMASDGGSYLEKLAQLLP